MIVYVCDMEQFEAQLTVTGIRVPAVTGKLPSPVTLTYRMSISSIASSIASAEA